MKMTLKKLAPVLKSAQRRLIRGCYLAALVTLSGCVSIPDGIEPVTDFDADRYLGTWYEVARLNHRFERGLYNVTATYSKKDDGSVRVENRGYALDDEKWKSAVGKAKFVSDPGTAHLKVSFFGPIYGSYVVFELGEDYDYAFVTGNNRKSLWFLSREQVPPAELMERFKTSARAQGFDLSTLIDDVQRPGLGE